MKQQQALIGQATDEQQAEWKKKYGEFWEVKVEGHIAYFRKPDRKVMSYISTVALNQYQMMEEIFSNCKIGGSSKFEEDDDFFFAAMEVLQALVQFKQAEIVKR